MVPKAQREKSGNGPMLPFPFWSLASVSISLPLLRFMAILGVRKLRMAQGIPPTLHGAGNPFFPHPSNVNR